MNHISRHGRLDGLSDIDRKLESIESLNELVLLYQGDMQRKLDEITDNKTLQKQIKYELGVLD